MAGAEVAESKSHAKGKKKKKKRAGVHIDMTPMVDVAMLLLTFFMLTTVFNKPQTMELNLPPDDNVQVEVAASTLLTVRVMPNMTIYWSMGNEPTVLRKLTFKELRPLLVERLRSNPKLITLVQIDRDSKYNDMVDIMDELNLANITKFSFAPMKDADKKLIAKVAG
ncbi:MAG: biopolymer transporter ExbD [Ignavibacteriae bacterium]|nr:MAG: biopolymer transporter ExbD [Ignavibacteriota bacterium]